MEIASTTSKGAIPQGTKLSTGVPAGPLLKDIDRQFLEYLKKYPVSEMLNTCIQCGICSGTCPVAHEMDYKPHEIIRMIQLGQKKQIMESKAIWICVNCYLCTIRCPRNIERTEILSVLRSLAISEGYRLRDRRNYTFYKAFTDSIKKHGRVAELHMIMDWFLHSYNIKLVTKIPFALRMLVKHKIKFRAHNIKNRKIFNRMFDKSSELWNTP
jgi:heterodisulfide reductase subunit C